MVAVRIFDMKFLPIGQLKRARGFAAEKIARARAAARPWYEKFKERVLYHAGRAREDRRELVRLMALVVAGVFLLNYAMYSYHTDKNVLDIFPSLPLLEKTKEVTVYLPALDGKSILTEKRSVPVFDSDENYAYHLFKTVEDGSIYDNTSLMVPVEIFIKKVWFNKSKGTGIDCVFDVETPFQEPDAAVIKGSEVLFMKALEKTIRTNIPSVKRVYVLENGVPGKPLWEVEL